MKDYLPLPFLFLGFWMFAYIAGPRQSELTSDHTMTVLSTMIAAGLITVGFWFLCSKNGTK